MYDVAIVGAGPAGATLARLIGPRARVLLIDRGRTGRPKVCGGLLAPAAQKELARQGLGVPADVLAGPQLFAVRAVDAESGLERRYQRHYLNIDRGRFDEWLVGEAAGRCDYRPGWRVTAIEAGKESVLLRVATSEGAEVCVAARLVVGADGAGSIVRRAVTGAVGGAKYVAVQASFSSSGADACYGAVFSPGTDYYGWLIPKGATLLVGGAFPRGAGVSRRFDALAGEMSAMGFGLGRELGRTAAPLARPAGPGDVCLGRGRVALVGEAAGLISPSSAEGISYALRSSAALAVALERSFDDPVYEYRRWARPVVAEVLGKVGKARALGSGVLRRFALATGLGAITDDEVDGFAGALGELLTP